MSRDIFIEPPLTAASSGSASTAAEPYAGGTAVAGATTPVAPTRSALVEELRQRAGGHDAPPSGWFTKLIAYYLRRYKDRDEARRRAHVKPGQSVSDAARRRIFRASGKSATSGAAAGPLSTAATLITAETEGLAGLVAIPIAALGIGGEM